MIVSIYIEEHEFLIDSPQTLNFGGEFLYSFIPAEKDLIVQKKLNQNYISDFFNVSNSQCKIDLLSSIVGENGVGKSTLFDLIRKVFVDHSNSMPYADFTILIEENGETKVLYSNKRVFFPLKNEIDDSPELIKTDFLISKIIDNNDYPILSGYKEIEKVDLHKYQTIYYSPHFDLKYNNNFSQVDKYDVSLDHFIDMDLKEIDKKGTNENGWRFDAHVELVFKNTLRQVEFKISDVFEKMKELKSFELPDYDYITLYFRDIQIDDDFWNTPNQFRGFIKKIKDKSESEINNWHLIRKLDKEFNVLNQAEVNEYILKRFIINSILSVIISMMEERNSFLNEGYLEVKENEINDKSIEELFLLFIDKAFIKLSNKKRKIFDGDLYSQFFSEINSVIKGNLDEKNIKNQSLEVNLEDVKDILLIHRKMVLGFFKYYKFYDEFSIKNLNLYEFISIRPHRNMSSGELALLNLFSRLHYFIENFLKGDNSLLPQKTNYILLLDEADLGFHPIWRKKFIETILNTLPLFFESLQIIPKLQIILTTHDPLTLSDFPNNNVVFLRRKKFYSEVINDQYQRIQRTFGANITDILADSFFVGDGLIGDFAKKKIAITLNWLKIKANELNRSKNNTNSEFKIDPDIEILNFNTKEEEFNYHKQIIDLIGEPLVKDKLMTMFLEYVGDDNDKLKYELEKAKAKVIELEKRINP